MAGNSARWRIRCKKCGDIIYSSARHDLQFCGCASVFVDGGNEYFRIGWPEGEMDNWIEFLEGLDTAEEPGEEVND